ncbi:MAG: phosphoribosylglycinamide formyltransferase [Bergeyella sp.]|nr:phosphoribosylglycinamide formyltransferase [Bergeyella sp.]
MSKKNIVVLASGSGTNFQKIMEACERGEIRNSQITKLVADRECFALERARKAKVEALLLSRENFSQEWGYCIPKNTDLIVLAGFLSILSPAFCALWEGKMINVHPSLLPKYGGVGMWGNRVHEAVIAAGEKESGASVHFVTSEIDQGEVILQGKVSVEKGETPESLARKVREVEYDILPKAIEKIFNV